MEFLPRAYGAVPPCLAKQGFISYTLLPCPY
jgi:hypothetical protein